MSENEEMSSAEEDILTELRQYHWCEGEEWTCNNCRAADEIERLRRDYAILLERWREADAWIAELLLERWRLVDDLRQTLREIAETAGQAGAFEEEAIAEIGSAGGQRQWMR